MRGENVSVLAECRVAEVLDEYLENSFRDLPAMAMVPHRGLEPQEVQGGLQAPLSANSKERGLKC